MIYSWESLGNRSFIMDPLRNKSELTALLLLLCSNGPTSCPDIVIVKFLFHEYFNITRNSHYLSFYVLLHENYSLNKLI